MRIPSASANLRRRNVPQNNNNSSNFSGTDKKKNVSTVVQNFDMFTKVEQDLTVQTEHGGLISLIGYAVIFFLVVCEIIGWTQQNRETIEHLVVDTSLGKKMRVNLNVTFPELACEDLHLDVMDVAGDSQLNIEDTLKKRKLYMSGVYMTDSEEEVIANKAKADHAKREQLIKDALESDYCGPCYGAQEEEGQCCQTCEEVRDAYEKKNWNSDLLSHIAEQCIREGVHRKKPKKMKKGEGCNLSGFMNLNRVSGNFHIAMGEGVEQDGRHVHLFAPDDTENFNSSHIVHELSFGPHHAALETGSMNGLKKITTNLNGGTGLFQYFLKVVPTIYKDKISEETGEYFETNRYFFTERYRPLIDDYTDENFELGVDKLGKKSEEGDPLDEGDSLIGAHAGGAVGGVHAKNAHHSHKNSILPGVFFVYEIYPFAVEVTTKSVSVTHLLIRVMAVFGGVLTIMGWVDTYFYSRGKVKRNN